MAYKFEFFTKDIQYQGHNVQTYALGSGQTTVFSFPSFPHSGLMYMWFLNHYDLSKIRFITFDLPGWIGHSDNFFEQQPFKMPTLINLAKTILRDYQIKEFNLIGYSFGGALALMLNQALPKETKKIVLVSSVINGQLNQNDAIVRFINLLSKLRRIKGVGYLFAKYVQRRFNYYKQELVKLGAPVNELSLYEGMLKGISGNTLIDSITTLFNNDWSQFLTGLEQKEVMIVNSKDESPLFRKQAEYLRKHLQNERSLFFHGSHEDFVLKPKSEIVKQVVRFLH